MKRSKVWISALLVLALLAIPSALAEEAGDETISVPVHSVYERAAEPGLYLDIKLDENTSTRMTTRLGQIIARYQDRFDDEATAATVIKGWFDSTHYNFDSFFVFSTGSSGPVRIPADYLRMYDFVAVCDASGRSLFYPFRNYEQDLYADLCEAALPVISEQVDSLLDPSFRSTMEKADLVTEDMRSKLEVAYDELRPTFTVAMEDVQKAFTPDTLVDGTLPVSQAIDLTRDLIVSDTGAMKPLKVASENTSQAWFRLTLSGSEMTGSKLSSPVSLSEIRSSASATPTLWLNEAGELIYITASEESLSVDAAYLSRLLTQRGGEGTQSQEGGQNAPVKENSGSSNLIWYIVAGLAVIGVACAAWYALRSKGSRSRYGSSGGAAPVEPAEPEPMPVSPEADITAAPKNEEKV